MVVSDKCSHTLGMACPSVILTCNSIKLFSLAFIESNIIRRISSSVVKMYVEGQEWSFSTFIIKIDEIVF